MQLTNFTVFCFSILDKNHVRTQTLEALSNELQKKFDVTDHFKGTIITLFCIIYINVIYVLVGTCLVMLLQQDLLPEPEQRLAAVTLLHEMYRGEPVANTPFANVFIHLLVGAISTW